MSDGTRLGGHMGECPPHTLLSPATLVLTPRRTAAAWPFTWAHWGTAVQGQGAAQSAVGLARGSLRWRVRAAAEGTWRARGGCAAWPQVGGSGGRCTRLPGLLLPAAAADVSPPAQNGQ